MSRRFKYVVLKTRPDEKANCQINSSPEDSFTVDVLMPVPGPFPPSGLYRKNQRTIICMVFLFRPLANDEWHNTHKNHYISFPIVPGSIGHYFYVR